MLHANIALLTLTILQVVDAVLAVKATNDRGDVKYPIKVCPLCLKC